MTEKEKMLAGELYDCADPELMAIWHNGKNLAQRYNALSYVARRLVLTETRLSFNFF